MMAELKIQEEPDQVVLHIRGEVTVQNATEVFQTLKAAFDTGKPIVVDTATITETDVSFLQMICSLHRSCVRTGRTMILASPASHAFLSAVASAGYLRLKGCKFAGGAPCLWQRREDR
ncbi:MAG: STAS domain-containing protein [Thermodesulfobacteriota bacterium]